MKTIPIKNLLQGPIGTLQNQSTGVVHIDRLSLEDLMG
jgi:hypothetical protein